jgi:hypothetical protein
MPVSIWVSNIAALRISSHFREVGPAVNIIITLFVRILAEDPAARAARLFKLERNLAGPLEAEGQVFYDLLLSEAGETNEAGKYLGIARKAELLSEEKALVAEALKRIAPHS